MPNPDSLLHKLDSGLWDQEAKHTSPLLSGFPGESAMPSCSESSSWYSGMGKTLGSIINKSDREGPNDWLASYFQAYQQGVSLLTFFNVWTHISKVRQSWARMTLCLFPGVFYMWRCLLRLILLCVKIPNLPWDLRAQEYSFLSSLTLTSSFCDKVSLWLHLIELCSVPRGSCPISDILHSLFITYSCPVT